jgi:hypothetical protein
MSDEQKFRPQDEVDAKRPLADDGPAVEGHMFKSDDEVDAKRPLADDGPEVEGHMFKREDPEAKRP